MKQFLSTHGRTLALAGVLLPLLALFVYVGLRSGPLAPVPVTVATGGKPVHRARPVRHRHGGGALHLQDRPDRCRPGQVGRRAGGRPGQGGPGAGRDGPDRSRRPHRRPGGRAETRPGQCAGRRGADSGCLGAQALCRNPGQRYEKLLEARSVSEEAVEAKRQERQVAEAGCAPRAPIWMPPARSRCAAAPSAMA
jgi:HlyD family secretion protein